MSPGPHCPLLESSKVTPTIHLRLPRQWGAHPLPKPGPISESEETGCHGNQDSQCFRISCFFFSPSFPSHFELIHLNWHHYRNDTLRSGEPAVPLAAHRLPWSSGASLPPARLSPGFSCHSPSEWLVPLGPGRTCPKARQGLHPREWDRPGFRASGPCQEVSWAPVGTGPGLLQVTETPSTNGLSLHQGFKERDCPEETRVQY